MKALVYDDVETLVYRDMPDPVPALGQSLIKIEASGICGSDMHAYLGHDTRRPAPLILGHEAAGRIEAPSGDLHQQSGLHGRLLNIDEARAAV